MFRARDQGGPSPGCTTGSARSRAALQDLDAGRIIGHHALEAPILILEPLQALGSALLSPRGIWASPAETELPVPHAPQQTAAACSQHNCEYRQCNPLVCGVATIA